MFKFFKKLFKKNIHQCINMTKIGAGLWQCNDCKTKWELKGCYPEESIENSPFYWEILKFA